MPDYHYQFENVEEYLHHRPPYLMIDRICSLEDEQVVTEKAITGEEFFLPGHFPGAAIFPGAMMQELVTQSAGLLIAARHNPMSAYDTGDPHFNDYALGVLVRVRNARYRRFARPGDTLNATVKLIERIDQLFEFSGTVAVHDHTLMTIGFQLANIPSSALLG